MPSVVVLERGSPPMMPPSIKIISGLDSKRLVGLRVELGKLALKRCRGMYCLLDERLRQSHLRCTPLCRARRNMGLWRIAARTHRLDRRKRFGACPISSFLISFAVRVMSASEEHNEDTLIVPSDYRIPEYSMTMTNQQQPNAETDLPDGNDPNRVY